MRIGPIEFYHPPLVEGPRVMFYIPVEHHFSLAHNLGNGMYGLPVTITVITTWAIMAMFFIAFFLGMRKLKKDPSKTQVFFEMMYNAIDGLTTSVLGNHKSRFLAYIGTLISFIAVANIFILLPIPGFSMGEEGLHIFPMFKAPTSDLNTTVGLALITMYVYLSSAIRNNGIKGYFGHMMEPTPIMFPIHLIGEFAKPTNISMRLFGNIFAGGVIIGLMYSAAPWIIPIPLHMYFDLFVGLVQAYVFTMLTLVYIQTTLREHH